MTELIVQKAPVDLLDFAKDMEEDHDVSSKMMREQIVQKALKILLAFVLLIEEDHVVHIALTGLTPKEQIKNLMAFVHDDIADYFPMIQGFVVTIRPKKAQCSVTLGSVFQN